MCNFWILFLYGESFQWITTIAHSPHYPSDTTLGPCTLSHTSSSFNMPSSINRTTPSTHLVLQLSHPLLHSVLGGSCESIPNATHALAHTPSLTHPRPLTHPHPSMQPHPLTTLAPTLSARWTMRIVTKCNS